MDYSVVGVIVCWWNMPEVPEGPNVYSYRAPSDRAPAERDVFLPQSHSAPLEPELDLGLDSYRHLVPSGPDHSPATHYYPTTDYS